MDRRLPPRPVLDCVSMTVADAVARILMLEGVEVLFAYPLNPLIESASKAGIRPVIVRQERTGLHMADAFSRMHSGERIGVFCMQSGPGAENAFGGVAQAYAESAPIMVLPMGHPREWAQVPPNFNSSLNYRQVTKSCEQVTLPAHLTATLRRAFTQVRNGRPRPVLVEFPSDLLTEEVPEPFSYRPAPRIRFGPDGPSVTRAAELLLQASRPVIYAGQGVHYAKAWQSLRELAELLEAPVTTSLGGKSAFPENHPLSLGSGGRSTTRMVHEFLNQADLIFGVGCSFTTTPFGLSMPSSAKVVHATLDSADINKDVAVEHGLVGDARLVLEALVHEIKPRLKPAGRGRAKGIAQRIQAIRKEWMAAWSPKLTASHQPLSPYRVIRDLMRTVDVADTIITHDSGSPRDQLSPFWECVSPLSYIGWGKSTQLGYGLGLALGAKLARPDKLCINLWGDAAIGFTGTDLETAVREKIPILSILLNNFCMAAELQFYPTATVRHRITDISGNYADMARSLGCYSERVEKAEAIVPALERGIRKTREGLPVLLEFMTTQETEMSVFP